MSKAAYAIFISIALFQFPMYLGNGDIGDWANHEYSFIENSEGTNLELSLEIENLDFGSNYVITTYGSNNQYYREEISVVRDDSLRSSCYSDDSYGQARAWGMVDHLASEAAIRKTDIEISHILWNDFLDSNYSGHLFLLYDEFPADSDSMDILSKWVGSGGILITQGRFFNNLGESKSKEFLKIPANEDLKFWEKARLSTTYNHENSRLSEAFGLGFAQSTYGFSSEDLQKLQGTNLGPSSSDFDAAAISFIPLGSGGIVHFGGCLWAKKWFDDEKRVSYDVLNIVQSGISRALVSSNIELDSKISSSIKSRNFSASRSELFSLDIQENMDELETRFLNFFIFNSAPIGHRGHSFQINNPIFYENPNSVFRSSLLESTISSQVSEEKLRISLQPMSSGDWNAFVSFSDSPSIVPKSIGIYWDEGLSPICNDIQTIGWFIDDFSIQMENAGIEIITISDEDELVQFLSEENTKHLLFATSVIPTQALNLNQSIFSDWVSSGGILYWVGDLIGGFTSSDTTEKISWDHHENLKWDGEIALLGKQTIFYPGQESINSEQTEISNGLKLDFSPYKVSPILNLNSSQEGIHHLGKMNYGDGWSRSSITFVSSGNGGALIFGGCLGSSDQDNSPWRTSSYLSRIILSGIVNSGDIINQEYSSYSFSSERFTIYEIEEDISNRSGFANIIIFNQDEVLDFNSLSL